jgi:hypothetical protein
MFILIFVNPGQINVTYSYGPIWRTPKLLNKLNCKCKGE